MKKILVLAAGCCLLFACNSKKEDKKAADDKTMSSTKTKPAAELLDLKEGDMITNSYQSLAKGDIDAMTAGFDDNIHYTWSGGDSLIGKTAVMDYWKGRWNLIKSLNISDVIILPIQINESQQPTVEPPGKWVLYWAMNDVTYKNNKNLKFWIHSVNHFNDAGKIDFTGLYYDRAPIQAATKDLMK